jgi:hypothetical protein
MKKEIKFRLRQTVNEMYFKKNLKKKKLRTKEKSLISYC